MRPANNDSVKQCLIVYHIRMDTPEPQKQFRLWWACQSISRLKSLIQRDSDPKCRNNIVVFTNNNTKHWCKCFDTRSRKLWKQYPPKSWTISEPSTFRPLPHMPQDSSRENPHNGNPCFKRSPHQYPPPRPRLSFSCASTAALASRSRSTTESWPWKAASCSGVMPQEPQPEAKPQAEPKRNLGEKSSEKILGTSKVEVLESVVTQKSSLNLRNNVVLRMFWWHRAGWKRPCEPGWQSKCFVET